jgi:polysaccharide deacetylase 2 family uncharacterized protein YibQ
MGATVERADKTGKGIDHMAFLKGAFWGVVVGGAGAVAVSVIAPQPAGRTPPSAPLVVLDDALQMDADSGSAALPQVAAADAPAATARVEALGVPDAAPYAPAADSDAPAALVAEDAPAAPQAPAMPDTALASEPGGDAPVFPNPQSTAPQLPEAEADIVVDATVNTPVIVVKPVPDAEEPIVVIEETADERSVAIEESAQESVAQVTETTQTPVTVQNPDAADAELVDDLVADTMPEFEVMPGADVMPEGDYTAEADVITEPGPNAAPVADTEEPAPFRIDTPPAPDAAHQTTKPASDPAPTIDTDTASKPDLPAVVAIIDTPFTGLPRGTGNVVIRRPGVAEAEPVAPAAEPDAALSDAAPALIRYGAFFDNAAGLPLMSVILIDDGRMANGVRALADVPFAVTVLLDPSAPGAAERMGAYADAGIEIAALAALPDGGTITDAAVALEGTFSALPRAVALVATEDHPIPSRTDVVGRVMGALSNDGRGLVMPDGGLNSTLRAAEAADVHAAMIYRDLDGNGQDARVIRRFIDQAAFRARQQPGVVLMGRVQPETISALILWGTANRAGQVALAPLSATLLTQ